MIGIKLNKCKESYVEEFFQLFKTPWEYYQEHHRYSIAIIDSQERNFDDLNAQLIIIIKNPDNKASNPSARDSKSTVTEVMLKSDEIKFPVYCGVEAVEGGKCLVSTINKKQCMAAQRTINGKTIIHVGYNLFDEIEFLLLKGQPLKYAYFPTLDIHIYNLRKWIVALGIKLIEIPPIKLGSNFHVCLTHDVDFIKIANHKMDKTLLGFFYRATLQSLIRFIKRHYPLKKMLQNWYAALTIPFVFMGLKKDIWIQFKQYIELEKNIPSTFFFVPFKNKQGMIDTKGTPASNIRKTKYEISDFKKEILFLLGKGCEIGVHGIDAWISLESAQSEYKKIRDLTGQKNIGIRMHWLYFNKNSFDILEKAKYQYDSTIGYNENAGYRSGTHLTYKPDSTKNLIELPLHVMDTSLFYDGHMSMTYEDGINVIQKFADNAETFGGVLTINWHHRSIAPERLWIAPYTTMINYLSKKKASFNTAASTVAWFKKRRAIHFKRIYNSNSKESVRLNFDQDDITNDDKLFVRVYNHDDTTSLKEVSVKNKKQNYCDYIICASEKKLDLDTGQTNEY